MSPEDRAPRSYRGLPADGPALVLRTPGAVALGDGQPSMLQEITRRRMRWPGGEFRYQTRTCGGSLRIRGRPTNCRVGCKKDRNEYCQLPMCFYRCLLVGFVMTACSRRAPTERAPLVAPPSPQPIAPSTPTPPLALDCSLRARCLGRRADASPPSPGACVFVGGNARCTRCIRALVPRRARGVLRERPLPRGAPGARRVPHQQPWQRERAHGLLGHVQRGGRNRRRAHAARVHGAGPLRPLRGASVAVRVLPASRWRPTRRLA